ncbi:MAG: c-type cytochrome [Candidatus Promineifilaceae bacterium]|nr:c-type cytochrome [Candidatus Promineifilaceae bacterium]
MKRILKWTAIILAVLLAIVILAYGAIAAVSAGRLNRTYETTADFNLNVPDDPQSINEGKRLYTILCQSCHGEDLSGQVVSDFMMGQVFVANLTSGEGGIAAERSDEDMARAVWYGVKPDGSPTFIMAPELSQAVNVSDMEKIIAYIRSVPPVDTDYPQMKPGPMLRLMHTTNQFPLVTAEMVDLNAPPPGAITKEDVLAFGQYKAALCTACHGPDFTGSDMAGGTNITAHESALGSWTEEDFFRALREGVRPDGSAISTDMPWETLGLYTDEEIHAIWEYLQTVPELEKE